MTRRDFRRSPSTRKIGRKVVIACEGSKTEPGYFEGIRQTLRLPTLQVVLVRHEGSDPRSVVQAAIEERNRHRRDQTWEPEDTAWAVFDGDEHMQGNPQNWNDALQIAKSRGILLAVSNPCFELWYLLHFQDQFGFLPRNRARELLRDHVPNYEKASRLYPDPLRRLTQDAIRRAGVLADHANHSLLPPHSNPCTGVASLVESLLALAREGGAD